jgi:hypothetical protein
MATDAGGLTATSDVPVFVTQTLTTLTITPANVTLALNATQAFAVSGLDQFSRAMTVTSPTWNIDGIGAISSTGVYTAPAYSGSATVRAESSGKSATAAVTITNSSVTSLSDLTRNGSSEMAGTRLRLANNVYQAGSAFTRSQVEVSKFDTTFRFRLTSLDGTSASIGNGITFAVQNQGTSALGNWNEGHGFTNIRPGVAVRYDAVNNVIAVDSVGQIVKQISLKVSVLNLRRGIALQ